MKLGESTRMVVQLTNQQGCINEDFKKYYRNIVKIIKKNPKKRT